MDETKYWRDDELDEIEKLCAPLIEFLQRHDKCTPYSWIIVQWNGVTFMPESIWLPFKVPD